MKALVIEDDRDVANYLLKGLRESDFVVDHAADGKEGMMMAASEEYDIMIVDRMLPGMDGLSIIKTVRATGNQTPVLILSALGDVDDRVEGLRGGGDDYLTKPFSFTELLARIESLIRRNRQAAETETVLKVADLEMDLLARTVKRAGQNIDVQPPREFRLLEYLMRNAGQVVTRTMLLEKVWDYHFDPPQTNVIDVHISRLRAKIDKEFDTPPLLQTVRGGRDTCYVKLLSQLRTSSFQLALLYMVVFATSVFLLLAFIYWRTAGFMTAQTDETIEAEIAGLAEQYRSRGVNGLITIIRERVARDPNAKSIYLLTTDDFLKLAGNIETWPEGSRSSDSGWINFTLNPSVGWQGPPERLARARIFEVQGGLRLLVGGRDVDDLTNLKRVIETAINWGGMESPLPWRSWVAS